MSTLNGITRLERITTTSMEAMLDGSYREHTHESWAWMCNDCRLVWDRRHHADTCASRGHRDTWEDGPYGVKYILNGVPQGPIHYYTRQALRREPAQMRLLDPALRLG